MRALVTGGYFDDTGEGAVWLVEFESETVEVVCRWTPPAHLKVPTKGFAGGHLGPEGTLYVAAHAAVLAIDAPTGQVKGTLHHPHMNDLHHVRVVGSWLYVVNTGWASVDVYTLSGKFEGSHSLVPGWVNAKRFSSQDPSDWETCLTAGWTGEPPSHWTPTEVDDGYHTSDRAALPFHRQKVSDFLHLNHAALLGGRLLVTSLYDGSVRDLSNLQRVFQMPGLYPHDGFSIGDEFWLTGIDGRVICLDAQTFKVRSSINVFESGHFGWCRGLWVGKNTLLVGLTEVRAHRLPKHPWAKRSPEGSETSVLLLERSTGRLLSRIDLSDGARHSKIYSILPLDYDEGLASV